MNTTEEISTAEYCAAFLVDFLASVGVERAELTFSGSGDSGDVDGVELSFKRSRKPSAEKIEEQWRLAVARHHLLYPEQSIRCFDKDYGDGDSVSPDSLVQKFFYAHVSETLGDWVNNEGGSGTMTVDVAERSINYGASYNEVQDAEPVSGRVENVPLFDELLVAVQPLGIASIDADLDFDYEGVTWSDDVALVGELRKPVTLEPEAEKLLARTCVEIARRHASGDGNFVEAETFPGLLSALYERFVKETALESRESESEGYSIALSLTREGGRAVLEWTATFRYMGSTDDDTGEILAPEIHAPVKRSRKRAA